jgi:hypothetical protein
MLVVGNEQRSTQEWRICYKNFLSLYEGIKDTKKGYKSLTLVINKIESMAMTFI